MRLQDFIKQLQEIEDENPGIGVAHSSFEYGIDHQMCVDVRYITNGAREWTYEDRKKGKILIIS